VVELILKPDGTISSNNIPEDVIRVLPDKNYPFSQGSLCPKASALAPLNFEPEKLRKPVRHIVAGTGIQ
jgi:anaerobic selenocysteine-containing dehydrogenase